MRETVSDRERERVRVRVYLFVREIERERQRETDRERKRERVRERERDRDRERNIRTARYFVLLPYSSFLFFFLVFHFCLLLFISLLDFLF